MQHHTIAIDAQRIHYVEAGAGDPVLLLHGWGQTWYEWRHVLPALAAAYRVVVPDLPGLGDSAPSRTGYTKAALARTMHAFAQAIGLGPAHVVGHDFGVAVAFAMAHEDPGRVRSLAVMELMLPGFGGEAAWAISRTGGRWHHVFHAKCELASMLIAGKERDYLSWFFRSFAYDPSAIGPDAVDEYVRAYSAPGAMDESLNYYRTCFDDEDQNRIWGRTPLPMPVLALGGAVNMGDRVRAMMAGLAADVTGGAVARAGHWIPEERPDDLIERLPAFFARLGG